MLTTAHSLHSLTSRSTRMSRSIWILPTWEGVLCRAITARVTCLLACRHPMIRLTMTAVSCGNNSRLKLTLWVTPHRQVWVTHRTALRHRFSSVCNTVTSLFLWTGCSSCFRHLLGFQMSLRPIACPVNRFSLSSGVGTIAEIVEKSFVAAAAPIQSHFRVTVTWNPFAYATAVSCTLVFLVSKAVHISLTITLVPCAFRRFHVTHFAVTEASLS